MHAPKRLLAATVATVAMIGGHSAVAHAATIPGLPTDASGAVCLPNAVDPGPLGPMGPYGQYGPWGPNGPLAGQANPLGDIAKCGGLGAFILRGGTLDSFVQANLDAARAH